MENVLKIIGAVGLLFLIAAVLALPTLVLWNWLMPEIFELPKISFWEALGLNFLTSILFKSNSTSKE